MNRTASMKWLCLAAALGLGACVGDDAPTDAVAPAAASPNLQPVGALAPPLDFVAVEAERDSAGAVVVDPTPAASARKLRRMSVKQLRRAIATVTDGGAWRDSRGRDQLGILEQTLGVPNYIDTTSEDLEASLVFQKFLGDGTRAVCDETVRNDLEMDAEDRVFLRHVEPGWDWESATPEQRAAIDQNLAYLKLRITGHGPDSTDDPLERERWLFRSVTHGTGDPAKGWRAVCVGLMSSPEFYLY